VQQQQQPQVLRLRHSQDARVASLRMTLLLGERAKGKQPQQQRHVQPTRLGCRFVRGYLGL
jgi:hypothetical protein